MKNPKLIDYILIIVFLILIFSTLCFASDLEFKLNLKPVANVSEKEFQKGTLHFNKNEIGSLDKTIFNAWRQYERTYRAYAFFEILDLYFENEWRNATEIAFVSKDGYVQKVKVEDLLRESKSKKGYLAYAETGRSGFSKFYKDKKLIDPGPFYLVWTNFTKNDVVKHSDILKWPFQLKAIIVINNNSKNYTTKPANL